VNEVADEIIRAMNLNNAKKTYKPVLHGVGWLGDVKKVALKIDKIKKLGFKSTMNSREAVKTAARKLLEEIGVKIMSFYSAEPLESQSRENT
jgi:UDP-glucose 4-epimerase